jgi:hypothetical protein
MPADFQFTPHALVGAGLLAMNDDTVCLDDCGAWIASKPAPLRLRGAKRQKSGRRRKTVAAFLALPRCHGRQSPGFRAFLNWHGAC